jgi:hypothetical protein
MSYVIATVNGDALEVYKDPNDNVVVFDSLKEAEDALEYLSKGEETDSDVYAWL